MNGITVTRFADFSDPILMAKQLADAVNKLEKILQGVPIFFGANDPSGVVTAQTGSIYIRTGAQAQNQGAATPEIYLKVVNEGSGGWLALLYTGSQDQNEVSAYRGSLYLKIPAELGVSAALYLKESDDASKTGWVAL